MSDKKHTEVIGRGEAGAAVQLGPTDGSTLQSAPGYMAFCNFPHQCWFSDHVRPLLCLPVQHVYVGL